MTESKEAVRMATVPYDLLMEVLATAKGDNYAVASEFACSSAEHAEFQKELDQIDLLISLATLSLSEGNREAEG